MVYISLLMGLVVMLQFICNDKHIYIDLKMIISCAELRMQCEIERGGNREVDQETTSVKRAVVRLYALKLAVPSF